VDLLGGVYELEWDQGVQDDGVDVSRDQPFMATSVSAMGGSCHLDRLPWRSW
jgi:hypothetical protein